MPEELTGRCVAVLVDNYYQELEVWYPLLRMREAGAEVFTIGTEAGTTYKSKMGYPVEADRAIDDVSVEDFDVLIIPGGWAPDYMRRNPQFVDLVANGVLTCVVAISLGLPDLSEHEVFSPPHTSHSSNSATPPQIPAQS